MPFVDDLRLSVTNPIQPSGFIDDLGIAKKPTNFMDDLGLTVSTFAGDVKEGYKQIFGAKPAPAEIPEVQKLQGESTLGKPRVSTEGWSEGAKPINSEEMAQGVLKVLTEPFFDRETYKADAPYLENVKTGLKNTMKAIIEAPALAIKFPATIARGTLGEPLRKWLSGESDFTPAVKEGVKEQVKGFADMIVSGIPGLDRQWAENLFMNPDTVVFGKVLVRDIAKGTVRKVSDVIDAGEAWKAKMGKVIEPSSVKISKALGKENQPAILEKMGVKTEEAKVGQIVNDAVTQNLSAAKAFEEKGKTDFAQQAKEEAMKNAETIRVADGPVAEKAVTEALKKAEKHISAITPEPEKAKVKPTQPDMLGITPGAMEGKIPSVELPETSIEKAARGAQTRKVEAEIEKRQVSMPEIKEAPKVVLTGAMPKVSIETGAITMPNIRKAFRRFKEFWMPLSSIPQRKEYLKIRYKTLGEVDIAEREAMKLFDSLKNLPPDIKHDMFRFQNGEIPITGLPDASTRIAALNIQKKFDELGQALVDRGMLSQETYEANKGQYIPYLYLKHILGDKFPVVLTPSGKLNLQYIKRRKDLTKEQQRAIGLVEDISVAAPTGIMRESADIVKFDMLAKVSDNPEWAWTPSMVDVVGYKRPIGIGKLVDEVNISKEMYKQAPNVPEIKARLDTLETALNNAMVATKNIPEDFVQLPNSKPYGDLAGAYVRKAIAQDIMPVVDIPTAVHSETIRTLINAEKKAMAIFKVGKVALNVPTMVRNTIDNFAGLNLSGIPLWEIPIHAVKAALAIKKKNNNYNLAMQNGIFKTNWAAGEINEVLDTVRTMQKKPYPDIIAGVMKLAKFYGKIDDFFKMTKFEEGLAKGLSPEDAALEAHKWVMDYSLAHPSVKWARRHIIPFVSYQYKRMPLLAEAAVKRPWVYAKYLAVPFLMAAAAKKVFNLTDEEWEKLKSRLPLFIQKNKTVVPLWWKSPEGEVQWFDYQYFLPWQNLQQFGQAENISDVVKATGIGNPILDVYTAFKSARGDTPPKDPFSGQDIYNQLDEPETKAYKSAEWIYNKWAPGMLTRYGTLGKILTIGQKDRYGRTVTPEQTAASLVGINIIAPTAKQAKLEKVAKIKQAQAQLTKILVSQASPEEKQRAKNKFKEYSKEILKQGGVK